MIRAFLFSLWTLVTLSGIAQNNVAINNTGNSPDPSAILDVSSTTKGMLIPCMTTSQRGLITSPAVGLLVFDTDTETFWFKETGDWTELVDSGKGLRDSDMDTRVEVESATDDDVIRFFNAGDEFARMDGTTLHLSVQSGSVYVGPDAGRLDSPTTLRNVGIGKETLFNNTGGYDNTALGSRALYNNIQGVENVASGNSSLFNNTSGTYNSAFGHSSMLRNTSGSANTCLGIGSNRFNQEGNFNTIIGSFAGGTFDHHSKSGNVFIGYLAGYADTTDNKLYIENSSSSSPLIYGDFTSGSELVGINGILGIGTQTPLRPLHIKADGSADSVQTIVAVLESKVSNRPVLLFSETGDADFNDGMSIEYNGAAGTGSSNELYINGTSGIPLMTLENSGDMGIGTTEPSVPLQVDGGSDASLTGGGYFMTNSEESTNIVIDNNEIMARDSGSSSTLYLQGEGGAVNIHGNLSEINQIHIKPSGYVGIGEVDIISDKLTVNAATGTNAFWVGHDGGTAFRVCANGGVTIGYLEGGSGPTYALQLYNSSSNMIGKARAYAWDTYSDGRFKHDQRPLGYGLDEILRLQPKSYVHQSAIDENRIESRDIGLIAQEIYPIVPEIVYRPDEEENDTWSVDYTKLIPLLINAIQEQQSMISHLRDQIEVLKSLLNHQD